MWNDSGSESPYLDYCNQYELKHYCFGDGGGDGGGDAGDEAEATSAEAAADEAEAGMGGGFGLGTGSLGEGWGVDEDSTGYDDMDAMSTDAPSISAEEAEGEGGMFGSDTSAISAHQDLQAAIDEDPASWEAAQLDPSLATDQYGRAIGTTYGYLGTTATSDRDAPEEAAAFGRSLEAEAKSKGYDVNVTMEKDDVYGHYTPNYTGKDAWAFTAAGLVDFSKEFSVLSNIQAALAGKLDETEEEDPSPETSLYDPSVQIDTEFDPNAPASLGPTDVDTVNEAYASMVDKEAGISPWEDEVDLGQFADSTGLASFGIGPGPGLGYDAALALSEARDAQYDDAITEEDFSRGISPGTGFGLDYGLQGDALGDPSAYGFGNPNMEALADFGPMSTATNMETLADFGPMDKASIAEAQTQQYTSPYAWQTVDPYDVRVPKDPETGLYDYTVGGKYIDPADVQTEDDKKKKDKKSAMEDYFDKDRKGYVNPYLMETIRLAYAGTGRVKGDPNYDEQEELLKMLGWREPPPDDNGSDNSLGPMYRTIEPRDWTGLPPRRFA